MGTNTVLSLVMALQILSALVLIGVILIQQGQGADMGAAFGSGAAGGLAGSSGGPTFMSRLTAALVTVFLVSTLVLTYFGYSLRTAPPSSSSGSVLEEFPMTLPVDEPEDALPTPDKFGEDPALDGPASDDAASGADSPVFDSEDEPAADGAGPVEEDPSGADQIPTK